MGRFPSGQREQTVNLSPDGFGGSNPPLPTNGFYCGNSSAVERQPSKLDVAGSIPVSRSIYNRARSGLIDALVAQLAEHILGKDEVTGSIPVKGSIYFLERALNKIVVPLTNLNWRHFSWQKRSLIEASPI